MSCPRVSVLLPVRDRPEDLGGRRPLPQPRGARPPLARPSAAAHPHDIRVHTRRVPPLPGALPAQNAARGRTCRVVWGAGPTGKAFARELLAQGTPLAAFVEVDPRKIGMHIHGASVVSVEHAADFPGTLALGAVSGPEGRTRVREVAAGLALVEGRDFVAVA